MYFPPTEILKIAYFLQPWARRAHRNPQNYIFFPKVGSIYPIKTFIPQMMASYIQYFWQFLTIFENFDNFAKLDFDDFFKIILPSKSSALKVVCPQSRLPSTSWAQRRCPQSRLPSMSQRAKFPQTPARYCPELWKWSCWSSQDSNSACKKSLPSIFSVWLLFDVWLSSTGCTGWTGSTGCTSCTGSIEGR